MLMLVDDSSPQAVDTMLVDAPHPQAVDTFDGGDPSLVCDERIDNNVDFECIDVVSDMDAFAIDGDIDGSALTNFLSAALLGGFDEMSDIFVDILFTALGGYGGGVNLVMYN